MTFHSWCLTAYSWCPFYYFDSCPSNILSAPLPVSILTFLKLVKLLFNASSMTMGKKYKKQNFLHSCKMLAVCQLNSSSANMYMFFLCYNLIWQTRGQLFLAYVSGTLGKLNAEQAHVTLTYVCMSSAEQQEHTISQILLYICIWHWHFCENVHSNSSDVNGCSPRYRRLAVCSPVAFPAALRTWNAGKVKMQKETTVLVRDEVPVLLLPPPRMF